MHYVVATLPKVTFKLSIKVSSLIRELPSSLCTIMRAYTGHAQ
jgi:hypothetical protein